MITLDEVKTLLDLGIDAYGCVCPPQDLAPEAFALWKKERDRAPLVMKTTLEIVQAHLDKLSGGVSKTAYDRALTLLADLVAALPPERTTEARAFLGAQP